MFMLSGSLILFFANEADNVIDSLLDPNEIHSPSALQEPWRLPNPETEIVDALIYVVPCCSSIGGHLNPPVLIG